MTNAPRARFEDRAGDATIGGITLLVTRPGKPAKGSTPFGAIDILLVRNTSPG
ncbi:MAG: hypothetical protein U0168_04535 [Nannocystaceae bacterium]